jgi:hypothetical protein
MHAQNAVLLHTVAARRDFLLRPFPTRAGGDAKVGRVVVAERKGQRAKVQKG